MLFVLYLCEAGSAEWKKMVVTWKDVLRRRPGAVNTSRLNAPSLTSHVPRNEVTDPGQLGHVAVNTIRNCDMFEVQ